MEQQTYLSWIKNIDETQKHTIGRKAARLVELAQAGFTVPNGFVVLPEALRYTLEQTFLHDKISHQLKAIDPYNPSDIDMAVKRIRQLLETAEIPQSVSLQIFDYYDQLGRDAFVSIRGSISDSTFSSAHQAPFLNVQGNASVLVYVRKMWASLLTPQNCIQMISQQSVTMPYSVIVEAMINSDAAGVIYTGAPDGSRKDRLFINAAYGIRDEYLKNYVYPDLYEVDKHTAEIINKEVFSQKKQLKRQGHQTVEQEITSERALQPKLTDDQIRSLARIAKRVHEHYFFPQKIEWSIENNQIFLLDTQPLSSADRLEHPKADHQALVHHMISLATGTPLVHGQVTGPFKSITTKEQISTIMPGDIIYIRTSELIKHLPLPKIGGLIIAQASTTDQEILYLKSSGVISIIAKIIKPLHDDAIVTVDSKNGIIYKGSLPSRRIESAPVESPVKIEKLVTATKLFADTSSPEKCRDLEAFDGLGLIKSEYVLKSLGFSVLDLIGAKQTDASNQLSHKIIDMIKLSAGRPVYYRLHDHHHANPGSSINSFRGAVNYLVDSQVVEQELQIITNALTQEPHHDFNLVVPFVRSPQEISHLKKIIARFSTNNQKSYALWPMIETPSAALLIDEILNLDCQGLVVGLNDLTMYTLAVDRSDAAAQTIYNQTHPAVQQLLRQILTSASNRQIRCLVSGDSLENNYDILKNTIVWGAYGICASPERITHLREQVRQIEAEVAGRGI